MSYIFKDTLIYIKDLAVQYDGVDIIKDINLEEKDVERIGHANTGQIIAIVGRSGRGKSTLFKAMTSLIQPNEGKVLIKDFESETNNAAKEVAEGDIGFVNQKYTLFRHKTVRQSLIFALRNSKDSEPEKEAKVKAYAQQWGLEAVLEKYPNELSGGQRQRAAIIEQLFCSDKFLVLDEPFSGLDIGNIEEVKKTFDLLSSTLSHYTIFFSTHDIELAVELAQSIYVIGHPDINGKRQTYGTFVKHYDLRAMGLAWKEYSEDHRKLFKDICEVMLNS